MAMTTLKYLRDNLGMTGPEFMREWRSLTDAEKDWYRDAARLDAKAMGVEITD